MSEVDEFPRKGSKGSGTTTGWDVEARASHPVKVGEQIFDSEWRCVRFDDASPIGVPPRKPYDHGLALAYKYDYAAAQALRWWFHAAVDGPGLRIETRLVEYKIKHSYECEAVGAAAFVGGEDRSSMMPRWNGLSNDGTTPSDKPAVKETPTDEGSQNNG